MISPVLVLVTVLVKDYKNNLSSSFVFESSQFYFMRFFCFNTLFLSIAFVISQLQI